MTLLRNFGIPERRTVVIGRRNKGKGKGKGRAWGRKDVTASATTADKPISRPSSFRFRAIPVPKPEDWASIISAVEALKEVVEILIGQRHDTASRSLGKAVLLNDIYIDGSPKDSADIQDYLRKVPHTVPTMEPDPHPQYATEKAVLEFMAFAAYGGMDGVASLAGIAATWNPVTNYPSLAVSTPRYMYANLSAGTLSVEYPGMYVFSVFFSIRFNEAQGGRITYVRIFDVTSGQPIGKVVPLFVGRNQAGLTMSISTIVEILPPSVGEEMRVEFGGGNVFDGVVVDLVTFALYSIGEFKGEI